MLRRLVTVPLIITIASVTTPLPQSLPPPPTPLQQHVKFVQELLKAGAAIDLESASNDGDTKVPRTGEAVQRRGKGQTAANLLRLTGEGQRPPPPGGECTQQQQL